MSWVKVDDSAPDDPRFLKLARGVRLLHFEALAWANRHNTGGAIPRGALTRLTDETDLEAAVTNLISAGLWANTDDGWQLLWLQNDQLAPEEVERRRGQARTRLERHRRHRAGDHSQCHPTYCKSAEKRVGKRVDNELETPPRPVPTSLPEGRDGSSDGSDAAAWGAAAAVQNDLSRRRAMASAIRDASNVQAQMRFLRTFNKQWGHLYPASPS